MKTNAADYAALVSWWRRGGESWGRREPPFLTFNSAVNINLR